MTRRKCLRCSAFAVRSDRRPSPTMGKRPLPVSAKRYSAWSPHPRRRAADGVLRSCGCADVVGDIRISVRLIRDNIPLVAEHGVVLNFAAASRQNAPATVVVDDIVIDRRSTITGNHAPVVTMDNVVEDGIIGERYHWRSSATTLIINGLEFRGQELSKRPDMIGQSSGHAGGLVVPLGLDQS